MAIARPHLVPKSMAMTREPLAVDLEQAAALIGVAARTLRKWASERKLPSIKLGNRLLFSVADLQEFLAAQPPDVKRIPPIGCSGNVTKGGGSGGSMLETTTSSLASADSSRPIPGDPYRDLAALAGTLAGALEHRAQVCQSLSERRRLQILAAASAQIHSCLSNTGVKFGLTEKKVGCPS